MNEERIVLPIKTERDGNRITKTCVEDVYKILNRVIQPLDKARELCDFEDKEIDGLYGSLVIGRGTSQPCLTDAFDEEIGNNIAFMKAKLNANIKKKRLLERVYSQLLGPVLESIDNELDKIEALIRLDIEGVRRYNPEFMKDYDEFYNLNLSE